MTTIHIHIARHFWQNKEYAVWQSSDMFPSSLLAWLKEHYAELVAGSQPKWIERPEGKVCFFFNEEKEIHGRRATRLTVCWSKEIVANIHEVYAQLAKTQGLTDSDALTFPIKAALSKSKNKSMSFNKLTVLGVFALIAISAYGVYFYQKKDLEVDQTKIIKSIAVVDEGKSHVPPYKPSQTEVFKSSNKTILQPFTVCLNITEDTYCFQDYIRQKCTQNTTFDYQHWLQHLHTDDSSDFINKGCPTRFKHLSDDSDVDRYVSEHAISKSQENKLRDFLK